MELATAAGWAGGALLVARIAPQLIHIRRTGSIAGISRTGVWCWLGNDIAWFTHGYTGNLPPLWASSAMLITLDLILLSQLRAHRNITFQETAGIGWAAAMLTLSATGSPLLAAALIAASIAGTVPHAASSIRKTDLSGVSPATWRLAGADGALWLVYGASVQDLPVTFYATLTLGCAAVILHQLRRKSGQKNLEGAVGEQGSPAARNA